MNTIQLPLLPPIKWAGGKTQIMPHILANLPPQWDKYRDWYHEPFLGGGAVMLNLTPSNVIAGDINAELINMYSVIKSDLDNLQERLESKSYVNTEENYYLVRSVDRDPNYTRFSSLFKSARFLYLNRHGYWGLCRYNLDGQLNMPYGHYKEINYQWDNLRAISNYLNDELSTILIKQHHWQESMYAIAEGDFVYLDPPYDPVSPTANFVGYSSHGFSKDDQIALRVACDQISSDGAYFMQSNAATPFILELYKDYRQVIIPVKRQINNKETKRESVDEVLIMNY